MNWRGSRALRIASRCVVIICFGSSLMSLTVLLSGSVRSALGDMISRSIARILPLKYAFVGDSLTVECGLRWHLGGTPFEAISFARGGADIRGVAQQIGQAALLRPRLLFVAAGLNDILLEQAPIEQIAYDFKLLLGRIPVDQETFITLIPYISDKVATPYIKAANIRISSLAALRGMPIIDLNPALAIDGTRRPEMTTDGIHFTERACAVWTDMIKLAEQNRPHPIDAHQRLTQSQWNR